MTLTDAQVATYREQGFVVLDDVFTEAEVRLVREHAQADLHTDSPRRVLEAGGEVVRATHGAHLVEPFFRDFVRLPRLLRMATQALGGPSYIHQFKINAKAAFLGELWEWHQDSFFWMKEDGMPESLALNVVIHLDEVTEFNGPLFVIPGSHRYGEVPAATSGTAGAADWRSTVSAKLKYTLDPNALRELVDRHGIAPIKGGPGTVLLFHPALVHGSSGNMSPYDRCLLILSYNLCSNRLRDVARPRPEFLAARDATPLAPLERDEIPDIPALLLAGGERN